MAGRIEDLFSRIGSIETSIDWIKDRAEEDRTLQNARHAENKAALEKLSSELKQQTTTAQIAAAAPQLVTMSRTHIAALISLGMLVLWFVGRAIEVGFGWLIAKILNIKFGG